MKKQLHAPITPDDLELSTRYGVTPNSRPRVLSAELFGLARELVIEHAGEEYRLRLTRQDKLILTK